MLSTRAGVCVCWNLTPLWRSELSDWLCMCMRVCGNRTHQSPLWLDFPVISSSYSEPAWGVWSVTSDNSIYSHVATQERSNLRDDALAQSLYVHLFHWQQQGFQARQRSWNTHRPHFLLPPPIHAATCLQARYTYSIIKAIRFRCVNIVWKKYLTKFWKLQ